MSEHFLTYSRSTSRLRWINQGGNMIMRGDGFYVSYNASDCEIYGSDTTALVIGQMERFFILNGDHRDRYAALIERGFEECLAYFRDNLALMNKRSDEPPCPNTNTSGDAVSHP